MRGGRLREVVAKGGSTVVIDVIDYSSMTYRLLINYYTAHERHFCFLVPFFFVCDSFSLYLNFLLTMSSNQSENETNKYADKNRLPGYRYLLWVFVSKVKLLWLRETSAISS